MESSTSTIVSQTVAINAPIDGHFWKLHVPQLFFWTGSEQQLAIYTLLYANFGTDNNCGYVNVIVYDNANTDASDYFWDKN